MTNDLLRTAPVDDELIERVRTGLAVRGWSASADAVASVLRAGGGVVGDSVVNAVTEAVRRESLGAGPLDGLLALPGVSDVVVNGAEQVFLDRGRGLEPAGIQLGDEQAVRRLATRLAATAGRRLDDASPAVDVRLPSGVRFHAVLAPIAAPGTCLSFRVPARRTFGLDDLLAAGSLTGQGVRVLRAVVMRRLAFVVSGGTGSGKTTLLAAMLGLVDPGHRLVIVEDATELCPDHPHLVQLESRPANIEGSGEVTLRELVRQALRMRPDRLVVGEVRGAEVVDLLAALNTGHEGGCGTVHANSAADVPARLEALAATAGLPRGALHAQLAAGLQAVLHLDREPDGTRRLAQICLLQRGVDGLVESVPAMVFTGPAGPDQAERGPAAARLVELLGGDLR